MITLLLLALGDGALIHSMDDLKVRLPKEKARTEAVDGKSGKAVRFSYDDGCTSAFVMTSIRGTPEWDQAAGFSFWVKGDGSKRFGGLQFIWNEDYAARYDYMFPIDSTEWRKITVAWRDLLPVLPGAKFIDPKNGPQPSKLSTLWFGKWWYWRDYGAHSFAIDEIRLEPAIPTDDNLYLPSGDPLARVRAKLKSGQPITIVTMGDSLTDYNHWANKPVNWPTLLKEKLGSATIVNPAIGGTELRQGIILIPRWLAEAPEPDLVTICYGGNDWNSGMRGEAFRVTLEAAVDRVRRLTKGKADILLMSTVPAVDMWRTRDELGAAARAVAASRKTGLADTEKAFHAAGEGKPESLFCRDKVHLGPEGHALVAETILRLLRPQ